MLLLSTPFCVPHTPIMQDTVVIKSLVSGPLAFTSTWSWQWKLSLWTCISFSTLYTLYQLHQLPKPVARLVGKISFFPTLPFTCWSRYRDYWTLVESHVFLGAVPIDLLGHIEMLHARGVRAVINLCDEYPGPVAKYKRLHMTQLHLPTVDHTEPSVEDMQRAMLFIQEHVRKGVRVYIHCKGGNGRSAAIFFCWLLYSQRMTPSQAQHVLNDKRRVRKRLFLQPNILEFYRQLQAKGDTTQQQQQQQPE